MSSWPSHSNTVSQVIWHSSGDLDLPALGLRMTTRLRKAEGEQQLIAQTDPGSTSVELKWPDGTHGRYNYVWLRDNCTCEACGDKSGGHRYLEIGQIPVDIAAKRITAHGDDSVEIEWLPDGHVSRYAGRWLRLYSEARTAAVVGARPQLWDGAISDLPSTQYHDLSGDDDARAQAFFHVERYGFCLIRGVPDAHDEIERLAGAFGYVRETHYGRVFDLISTPEQRILAQTSHAIRPHNDELFREPAPGIMVMHCLIASEDGRGESILVDGFEAARRLKASDPSAFELLTKVPMAHVRTLSDGVDDVALRATGHAIEVDGRGDVVAIRINERTMAPFDLPEDLMAPTYDALRKLLALVYDESLAMRVRLESGDAMIFDNHRVLHARAGFAGRRHIRQCHIGRDEFFSRAEVLRNRLSAEEAAA